MRCKVEALSLIGPIQLRLVNEDDPLKRAVATIDIPDSELAEVTYECARRAYHQGLVTGALWDICEVITSMGRPQPLVKAES